MSMIPIDWGEGRDTLTTANFQNETASCGDSRLRLSSEGKTERPTTIPAEPSATLILKMSARLAAFRTQGKRLISEAT
jgi:hypothetical protein